jgi:hypothetical protein
MGGGKLSHHPITPKPYHPKTLSLYLLTPASYLTIETTTVTTPWDR